MELITHNPFRILGLIGNSTERELQKQLAKIKRFSEVGKTGKFEFDFNLLSNVDRTAEVINEAYSQIEQSNNKLHHCLFWFVNGNHIDDAAINYLKNNNIEKAHQIWNKFLKDKKINVKNFTSLSNFSTLLILISSNNDELEYDSLKNGLRLKSILLNSEYIQNFSELITGNNSEIDPLIVTNNFIDSINEKYLVKLEKNSSLSLKELFGLFENYSESSYKYLINKYIERPQSHISEVLELSEKNRRESPKDANKIGTKLYFSIKADIEIIKNVLGEYDTKFKIISNKIADELIQCSIDYFNSWIEVQDKEPWIESLIVAGYAKNVVIDGQTLDRVNESIDVFEDWESSAPERKKEQDIKRQVNLIAVSIKRLKRNVKHKDKLNEIRLFLYPSKGALEKLKKLLGENDKFYKETSEAVINIALNELITTINYFQRFNVVRNIQATISTKEMMEKALSIMDIIEQMDMTPSARGHFNKNKRILTEEKELALKIIKKYQSKCYVATMAFGDADHDSVIWLREYRDSTLVNKWYGRIFIKYYYKYSPILVKYLNNKTHINCLIRNIINIFIRFKKIR